MRTTIDLVSSRTAKVGVIGLGYVGLPLAVHTAQAGFTTVGVDVSNSKVSSINQGINYIQDVSNELLASLVREKKLWASSDFSVLKDCNFVVMCVPTPLGKRKEPDLSFVISAVTEMKKNLTQGQVIILESTTYPGTTEELVLPLLEETGLKVGKDFYLAFSPERIDPGNKTYHIHNTPKVIGGVTKQCTEVAQSLYSSFVDRVIPVSSPRTAEMVKILENTFRAINIGLANEVAIMCNHLKIDTWEVIEAASSKPFGFMPFYPGPGLGGHCIPVDPHYLLWKLKAMDYNARFIQLADEVNSSMIHFVIDKIVNALNDRKKAVNGSSIMILGVAYKQDIDDCRESPSLEIIQDLKKKGAKIFYHDPFVPRLKMDAINMESSSLEDLSQYDCTVLITHHSVFDIKRIVEQSNIFIDTRNATKGMKTSPDKIIKL